MRRPPRRSQPNQSGCSLPVAVVALLGCYLVALMVWACK
jgi:hypothetical protein